MGQYDRKAQSQRKHGPILSSSASKAPARPPPIAKPEWRGNGYMKKAKPKPHLDAPKDQPTPQDQCLPVELQQLVLNIFKDSFAASEDFEALIPVLKEVNEKVLERDWEGAFGGEEKREGYALRWSPSRALAFANVMAEFCEERVEDDWVQRLSNSSAKAICFGGGAAEVMAFAGLLRRLRSDAAGQPQSELDAAKEEPSTEVSAPILDLTLIDSADWSSVISKLQRGATTPPTLSKYASASARASNAALLSPSTLNINFTQHDIFTLTTTQLRQLIGDKPILVTLFLTLSSLFKTSISKTLALFVRLDALLPPNSTILIIDTIIASISQPIPNSEDVKEYTMEQLTDRALLGKLPIEKVQVQGKGKKALEEEEKLKPEIRWEKIVKEEIKVNKLEEGLRYPGSLENVKFRVLAYQRL
ncbi:hypothetical protein VTO58DRAFT_111561 [Aureobasidium pullulans]|nr:hypothetical protein JADG_008775 [Aureobasidium pullulans]KAG2169038.1 hypothetical protein JADG_008777 [Aureobasidium pullulans]